MYKALLLILILFLCPARALAEERVSFTQTELLFIDENPEISLIYTDGSAPLIYLDDSGETKGIIPEIYSEVSQISGLTFTYVQAESADALLSEAAMGKADIIAVASDKYTGGISDLRKSETLLTSSVALAFNKSSDSAALLSSPELLDDLYSGNRMIGSALFGSGLDDMREVDSGTREYVLGNEASVIFYKNMYELENIRVIPISNENLTYRSLFVNGDPRLESIINKSLVSLTDAEKNAAIIEGSSLPKENLSFRALLVIHKRRLSAIASFIMLALVFCVCMLLRAYKKHKSLNNRYNTLANLSHNYIYEYKPSKRMFIFPDETRDILGLSESRVHMDSCPAEFGHLFKMMADSASNNELVTVELSTGVSLTFRIINTVIKSGFGQDFIMGKLMDISAETATMTALLQRAQTDGMTGLLNAHTCRADARAVIDAMPSYEKGFLMIMDIDKFKNINDAYGHLVGDEIIMVVSHSLKKVFARDIDITGRVGGDEFFIFTHGEVTAGFMRERIQDLFNDIHSYELIESTNTTVSLGCIVFSDNRDFDTLYARADELLYEAKNGGRNKFIIRIFDNSGNISPIYKTVGDEAVD